MLTSPVAGDSLRAALDRAFAAPAYRWSTAPTPFAWLFRELDRFSAWFRQLGDTRPGLFAVIIVACAVTVIAIFVHVSWVALRTIRYSTAADPAAGDRAPPPRDAAWFLAAADRLADEGHAAEAVVTAFQALALELAAGAAVRYHPSKTPREYAHEARLPSGDRAVLGSLVDELYGYAFAGVPCGVNDYRGWRARAGQGRWRAAED